MREIWHGICKGGIGNTTQPIDNTQVMQGTSDKIHYVNMSKKKACKCAELLSNKPIIGGKLAEIDMGGGGKSAAVDGVLVPLCSYDKFLGIGNA